MNGFKPLWQLPLAKLLLHLATYRGYGLFRDEYYYVACSRELAFGYVDHPPLSILLLAVQRTVFGDSVLSIRLLPALAGAATVFVVGLIARRLGGGRFAQTLAMVAVGLNFLFVFHYFSMNAFDLVIWCLAAYLVIRIVQGGDPRLWIVLGMLLGLGLQNKLSVLWLGSGLAIGLLITDQRRHLATRWPWLGAALALALFLPHVVWQAGLDWPTAEFIRNATGEKMVEVAPLDFVRGQLEMLNLTVAPLWLTGLVYLLVLPGGRRYRFLGIVYLGVFAILLVSGSSRSGYLAPAYLWLLPAGAVAWEEWLDRSRRRLRVVVSCLALGIVAIASALTAPFSLPVLPVETYIRYAETMGVAPSTEERKEIGSLPQHYADMFGWHELADGVAAAYGTLTEAERERAAIFTFNYGNSGALDHLGRERGLPPTLSGHNNYWLWGPRGYTGEVVIVVDGSLEDLATRFDRVERAGTVTCDYCMPYENNKPIWIARGLHRSLTEAWPDLKHFD